MTEAFNPTHLFTLESPADLEPPRIPTAYHESSLAFLESVHRYKTDALKLLIQENGWPTAPHDGEHAEAAAFIIAYHSDFDPDFQRLCHRLMLELVSNGYRRNLGFLAFLTDRILCNAGKHQRFGTQIREVSNGCFVPRAIEDIDSVDLLREQVGIPEHLFDYMQRVNSGDVQLYRPLLDEAHALSLEYQNEPNIIPFPKH
ncbi:MAG: DUF6624 domain-containing protein [Rickettsiales bacterium]|nr:DUF6624 domain-containing protein [Rickettsiales bacterium]